MPRKLRKVPQFLKEIPLGSGSEGDNASEWDYAEQANGLANEDYNHAQRNPDANYLGWWRRNRRSVYYFGTNRRTWDKNAEWSKYDWYLEEARNINFNINKYNEQVDLFNKGDLSHYYNFYTIVLTPPKEPQHTLGIQRWLQNKVAEYDGAVSEFKLELSRRRDQERRARDEENRKRQKELDEMNAKILAEKERQAKIKQQQEELRQKRDDALVQTFGKRIVLLEKAVDEIGKQKLDFDQFTVSNMTELDNIRRDLREIDAQSVQKQKETDEDISRLSDRISKLRNNSVNDAKEFDKLNKTVQTNAKELVELDKKYDHLISKVSSLKGKVENEAYSTGIGLARVHDKISKVQKDIREELTTIQKENKKINKDYIDGISVYKEQQKQLGEKVAANEKDNNDKIQSLHRDLVEVKKERGARVKYDVHSNNAAKRRTGTIFKNSVRARQYDAARDILKSYLSTIFAQYTTV